MGDCGGDSRKDPADFSVANGQIKHVVSGLCVALVNDTQGAPVALASCSGSADAGWSVSSVVNQPTFTSTSGNNFCLDLGSSSAGPAAPVRLSDLSITR